MLLSFHSYEKYMIHNPYKIDAMRCQSKKVRSACPIVLLFLQNPQLLFSSILIIATATYHRGYQFKAIAISNFQVLVEKHMPVSVHSWQLVADLKDTTRISIVLSHCNISSRTFL
jgi:hypothetical protein